MKQIYFPNMGTLPAFNGDTQDPNYYAYRFDYVLCYLAAQFYANGISISQPETSDFTSLQTDVGDFKTDILAYLDGLFNPDDGSDPSTRAVPAVPGASWTSIISRMVSLVVAGTTGVLPAVLADVAIEVSLKVFSDWLAGKVYPGEGGTLDEVNKTLRKALLVDPGVADFERSVFVGEKGGTGFWGLFQGDFTSLGQMLLQALYKDSEDLGSSVFLTDDSGVVSFTDLLKNGASSADIVQKLEDIFQLPDGGGLKSVFSAKDAGDNDVSMTEAILIGLIDSLTDGGDTINYSLLRRLLEGFELTVFVDETPVKVSLQGAITPG